MEPLCNKYNKIVVCKKDGTKTEIIRCADQSCIHFTNIVTLEQCALCPRHQERLVATPPPLPPELEAMVISSGPVNLEVPKTPGMIRRIMTWTEAIAGWIAAGRPERSDAEVKEIFNKFCNKPSKPCSWYDPDRKLCKGCGCNVSENGQPALNKIKMATQHCPQNLW
jgi:hypothetical protein